MKKETFEINDNSLVYGKSKLGKCQFIISIEKEEENLYKVYLSKNNELIGTINAETEKEATLIYNALKEVYVARS